MGGRTLPSAAISFRALRKFASLSPRLEPRATPALIVYQIGCSGGHVARKFNGLAAGTAATTPVPARSPLLKSKDVFHAVKAGRLSDDPARGAQRAHRESLPARSFVRELEPLASAGKRHGVITDDVAAANRV